MMVTPIKRSEWNEFQEWKKSKETKPVESPVRPDPDPLLPKKEEMMPDVRREAPTKRPIYDDDEDEDDSGPEDDDDDFFDF